MIAPPDQVYPVTLGGKTFKLSLADVIYDSPKGDFPHPNTMTCRLVAGDNVIYELEYYLSVAASSNGRDTRHRRRGSQLTPTPR